MNRLLLLLAALVCAAAVSLGALVGGYLLADAKAEHHKEIYRITKEKT